MIDQSLVAEIVQQHEAWLSELEGRSIEAIATNNWSPVFEHLNEIMAWQDAQAHEAQKANTDSLERSGAGPVQNTED